MNYNDSKRLAGLTYDAQMKNSEDEMEKGLSLTHEQVTDNYMEGTVDGLIEKSSQKEIPLSEL